MNRIFGLTGVVLLAVVARAQISNAQVSPYGLDPYRHTYHPEHGYMPLAGGVPAYGAYGGYGFGGGTTAAEGAGIGAGAALAGFGQAAQGVGQARVSTAQAQDIHQQAATEYLQNQNLAQQTAMETSQRKAQATQQWQEAQIAHEKQQIALYQKTLEQMSAAHRLTAEQFHVDTGVLHWPFVLRGPEYAELRNQLDHLYAARTPEDSGKDSSGYDAIQQACKKMQEIVNEKVRKEHLPVNDFVTAKHFISSIAYEAQFPVKASK